jgi:hypothetical protein
LLELCPDTLTDNFIIEAELLHADYLGTNTPALSRIGLYLRTHSPDVLFRRLVFSLQDYVPNPMLVKNGSFKPVPNTARFLDLFEGRIPACPIVRDSGNRRNESGMSAK